MDEIKEKAFAEALAEGEASGEVKKRMENGSDVVRQMLCMEGFTPELVACINGLGLDEVQQMADEMR